MKHDLNFVDPLLPAADVPKILALLPETWTHYENMSMPKIGFGLKLLGVDRAPRLSWRTAWCSLSAGK